MSNRNGLKILYNPIKLVHLYLIGLIVLYILGPFEWRTENPLLFYLYLGFVQMLMHIGFTRTIKKQYWKYMGDSNDIDMQNKLIVSHEVVLKYLKIFITINLILMFMYLLRNTAMSSFSLTQIFENLRGGISNSNEMYLAKFTSERSFGGRFLAPMITLMSPFTWPVIPLSVVYFKQISFKDKILTVISIFLEAARWISTGTNKGVIDLILILGAIILIKQWQKKFISKAHRVRIKNRKKLISFIVILVMMTTGFAFFGNNISSRVNDNYTTMSLITGNTKVNVDAPLMRITPKSMQPLLVYTTSYLTQGYYALSLALTEPFYPMFGVGNSYFLIENIQDTFNLDIWQYTYQERISYKNWHPYVNWHSLYMWLANDVSFIGVLIVMYLFGKYFAVVTFKSIVYKDPIGIALLLLVLLMVFYIPANNQILSSPITFMAFWSLNIFWVLKKKVRLN